jgi:MFS superfamily sulfate permease-like transporter
MVEAGGTTPLVTILSGVLIVAALRFMGSLFYFMPTSGLSALISFAVISALKFDVYSEVGWLTWLGCAFDDACAPPLV